MSRSDEPAEYNVRPAMLGNKSEQGFIVRTWLGAVRLNYTHRHVPNEVFYYHHHKLIESLYERPGAEWVVCSHPKDPTVLFGFMCGERSEEAPIVHFAFVKSKFRRWGLCTAMIDRLVQRNGSAPAVIASHMTPDGQRFHYEKPIVYNPYVAFYGLEPGWQKRETDVHQGRPSSGRSESSVRRAPEGAPG